MGNCAEAKNVWKRKETTFSNKMKGTSKKLNTISIIWRHLLAQKITKAQKKNNGIKEERKASEIHTHTATFMMKNK